MTGFEFTHTVGVRYQDYDMLGHVNNAVYLVYLEDARSAYLAEFVGLSPRDIEMVLAHLELDFRAPVEDAESVAVDVTVTDVGESSFEMAYRVRDGDTVALEGESVQVTIDPDTGDSRPVPEKWREAFERNTA